MKKIFISVTIKPFIEDKIRLKQLLQSGINIVRIPFWEPSISLSIKNIVFYIKNNFENIKILLDLPGNKPRFGDFYTNPINIVPGKIYKITKNNQAPDEQTLPIASNEFLHYCKTGDKLICGDGDAVFKIVSNNSKQLKVISEYPSTLYARKGLAIAGKNNIVDSDINNPLTDNVVEFAKHNPTDWIAISFVKGEKEINILKNKLIKSGNKKTKIISKIETEIGFKNYVEIVDASDGIMIGRGDLANYFDYGLLALAQKRIIKECNKKNKFSILSTGVLTSLLTRAIPRAAEISDITNAVIDGADCIQLCEETAHSLAPSHPVKILKHVINSTIKSLDKY
ncbi:MAG: pyruvate kinase [Candidatus Nealsonbacteria bacterium]